MFKIYWVSFPCNIYFLKLNLFIGIFLVAFQKEKEKNKERCFVLVHEGEETEK